MFDAFDYGDSVYSKEGMNVCIHPPVEVDDVLHRISIDGKKEGHLALVEFIPGNPAQLRITIAMEKVENG